MKGLFIRAAAILLAAAMTTASCACSSDKKSEDSHTGLVDNDFEGENISAGDMPEGSSIIVLRENDTDVPITIEYAKGTAEREEVAALSQYFKAVNDKNSEGMKKFIYPALLESTLSRYEAKDVDQYVNGSYEGFKSYTEEDFTICYIEVKSVSNVSAGIDYYDKFIAENTPDAKIERRHVMEFEVYYDTEKGSSLMFSRRLGQYLSLFVYTIDGQCYIM